MTEKNTVMKRLKQYLDYKGIAISKAAKEMGASSATLRMAYERNSSVNVEYIGTFVSIHQSLNLEWLLKGTGNMINEGDMKDTDIIQILNERLKDKDKIISKCERIIDDRDRAIAELKIRLAQKGEKQAVSM